MLEFSKEFFRAEYREDFFVDETMKAVWAAEIEVLQEIAVICDRHQLNWYAGFGTLLGAVRHAGFVPWDDDMDILMMRDDYMKLLEVMPQELPKEYYIRSCLHENGFEQYQTCVYNASTISLSQERLQRFHGRPFMVGVDIFPLDTLPRGAKERQDALNLLTLTEQAAVLLKTEQLSKELKESLMDALRALEKFYDCKLDKGQAERDPISLASFLYRKFHELVSSYSTQNTGELVVWSSFIRKQTMIFEQAWFQDTMAADFEEFMLPVPGGYDEILRTIYGDYTIRRRGGSMHDYPCYKNQMAWLEQEISKIKEQAALLEKKMESVEE